MKLLSCFLLLVSLLGFSGTLTAQPIILQVTNVVDGGSGSLRQVVASATAGATITFATNLSGLTLTQNSLVQLTKNVTIDAGILPGGIILKSNGGQFFTVNPGITSVLSSLTLTNGYDGSGQGVVYNNSGTLTLNNCTLAGNHVIYGGGAINNDSSTLTLNQCTLTGNMAASGGAIYNDSGTMALNNCTLSGNSARNGDGGAIESYSGTAILNNCTLVGNLSQIGGAIESYSGTAILNNCALANNHSTSTDPPYGGGAIYNNSGMLTISQCTLVLNSATNFGGAIYNNYGVLTLNQCTLTGNTAVHGGAIYNNSGNSAMMNCIVSGNSTFAGVFAASSGADIWNSAGTLTRIGANLIQFTTSAGSTTNNGPAAITNAVQLLPLGNYGGPTQTMPPLAGSPAIDAAINSTFATDQRGYPRPADGGTGSVLADIGAVEMQTASVNNRPTLGNAVISPLNHTFQFNFGYAQKTDFSVLTATNLALPQTKWTWLGHVMEVTPGQYQFIQTGVTNKAQFYRVSSP